MRRIKAAYPGTRRWELRIEAPSYGPICSFSVKAIMRFLSGAAYNFRSPMRESLAAPDVKLVRTPQTNCVFGVSPLPSVVGFERLVRLPPSLPKSFLDSIGGVGGSD